MMLKLKVPGLKAMHKETLLAIAAAVRHIEHHFSRELEKYMAPLDESIDRLTSAITTELQQVRAEAEANLEATKQALQDASEDNAELNEALQNQVSQNESLVSTIESAQGRLDSLSSGFEANDPQAPPVEQPPVVGEGEEPPPVVDEGAHVDNTLPGDLPPDEGTEPTARRSRR